MVLINKILWKSGILAPPIQNMAQSIVEPFEHGLRNTKCGLRDVWHDWGGNPLNSHEHSNSVEFILPWKFLLLRPKNVNSAYTFMANYSSWLVEHLQQNGKKVVPIVNFGNWTTQPPRQTSHRISWHSRSSSTRHLHLKIGTYPEHVSIDPSGFSGWSTFATRGNFDDENQTHSNRHFCELSDSIIRAKVSKYAQPTGAVVTEEPGYIFLAMQMPSDVVAELAYINTIDLLKYVAQISDETSKRVIVKRHPKCKNRKINNAIEHLKDHRFLKFSDGNIHDLISQSDMVITVNSGVGAEALLHKKMVVTTGASDYGQATTQVRTYNELKRVILSPHKDANTAQLEQFINAYTRNYMVHFGDDISLQKHLALNNFIHD